MWFATDHGISRFDGYSFKNYATGDGLTHNTVFGFFEDVHHRIWMRIFDGTLCYLEKGAIHKYAHNDSLQRFLGKHFIQDFGIDAAGDLWFMCIRSPMGLFRQDHISGRIERVKLKPGYSGFIRELGGNKFIAGIDLDNDADTANPNDKIEYADHTWLLNVKKKTFSGRMIVRAARAESGHYLFSYESELTEFAKGQIVKRVSLDPNPVAYLCTDKKNNFWVCGPGLIQYNSSSVFYSDGYINSVQQDSRGNFWLASAEKGVLFVPDMRVRGLKPGEMDELCLLTQFENRLYLTDRKSKLSILNLGASGPCLPIVGGFGTDGWVMHDLFVDKQHRMLFLGSVGYPIDKFQEGNFFTSTTLKIKLNFFTGFNRSLITNKEKLYMAGNNGWAMGDWTGRCPYIANRDEGFSDFCSTICLDSSGIIWIGANDGLFWFHNGRTQRFHPEDSLFHQRITDIECTPEGLVVVSTRGSGVIVIDKKRWYSIRATNGLTTDLCGRLAIGENLFWVCSNKGLNRVTIKQGKKDLEFVVTSIQSDHGLPSNLVNDAIFYGDLLILATGKGLAWFNTKNFTLNAYVPPVYIDEVSANQRILNASSELSYNETNLSFGFIGLLYNKPGKVQYRYRLEGYEEEWHYTQERKVRYFNLPDGTYRFAVSAMNENGLWNLRPATFLFYIPKHFSETWWFRTLIFLATLTLFLLALRYYLEQRRLRERITSGMLLAELKTLRSQMKPHFIFNSLSSIQHFIIEREEESAHLYLSRFSDLMRKILENTQKNTISLAREIETLELYLSLEKLRFGENFEYRIVVAPDIIADAIEVPPMLIQPYAENAIWHGLLPKKENARLSLRFFMEDKTILVCEIKDNGVGRKQAAEKQQGRTHSSTGMKNIEERIAILNRVSDTPISVTIIDLYDELGYASGTKVILKLQQI
jgi:hypothetical protein